MAASHGQDGRTPLWVACAGGHLEVARTLLAAGANKESAVKVSERGAGRIYSAGIRLQPAGFGNQLPGKRWCVDVSASRVALLCVLCARARRAAPGMQEGLLDKALAAVRSADATERFKVRYDRCELSTASSRRVRRKRMEAHIAEKIALTLLTYPRQRAPAPVVYVVLLLRGAGRRDATVRQRRGGPPGRGEQHELARSR
jgi:hypothetical protein